MSLKSFHIFFILVSLGLAAGFGFWGLKDFNQNRNGLHLALGIGSLVFGVILAVYLPWFLRKMKRVETL